VVSCSCGRRAVFGGRCAEHFREWLEGSIVAELEKFVEPSDVLAVAVSGGKDSTALLDVVHKWGGAKMFAVSVDEGIAGYRDRTLSFLQGFCEKRGIELHIFSFEEEFGCTLDEMLETRPRERACTVCGALRRFLLNKRSRELGATKILFAHNRDDELQTFLMNLLSGNLAQISRKGELIGVVDHPLFVVRLKPLFRIPEKATAVYALLNYPGLPDVECPYLEESARFRVRHLLNSLELQNPGAKERMLELYDREILPALKPSALGFHGKLRECGRCGEPSSRELCKVCELLDSLCPAVKS